MAKKLYVGNLPYSATTDQLETLFGTVGAVADAVIINDRDTGRSKGFGFVEMTTDEDAASAISQLNGREMDGRALTVAEARPRQPRNNSYGGGGNRW